MDKARNCICTEMAVGNGFIQHSIFEDFLAFLINDMSMVVVRPEIFMQPTDGVRKLYYGQSPYYLARNDHTLGYG
jgi:hypothetical protein